MAHNDQYVRQQDQYESCVRTYIERATVSSRDIAVAANAEIARIADDANAHIARLKNVVRGGIDASNAAALARSHSVEGTTLARNDPILMARAAENPEENSHAESAWPVVQQTPNGEGDPRPIICRAPQQLANSRLMGPKVCRRNGVWAVLRKEGKDVGPDGTSLVDLDETRRINPAACTTLPSDAMAGTQAGVFCK
jgi:hypothetical protein